MYDMINLQKLHACYPLLKKEPRTHLTTAPRSPYPGAANKPTDQIENSISYQITLLTANRQIPRSLLLLGSPASIEIVLVTGLYYSFFKTFVFTPSLDVTTSASPARLIPPA